MHFKNLRAVLAAGAFALALTLPAAAQAATAPAVVTGGAANVVQQAARLTGTVNPNGDATTYQFQYGTTSAYGAVTPEQTIGATGRKTVTADISGLAPATTYHYRLIARNGTGLTKGRDRSFKTKAQPLGVTFAATPNPVPFGGTTGLAGQLTGTGNGGREVVLQGNPFPYTQGFKNLGNKLVTDAAGNFSFGLMAIPLNTQYRVALPDKPSVISPIVVVSVSVRISTHVGTKTVHRGHRLTFQGSVRPAVDGTPIAIQKRRNGKWITVAGTVTRHNSTASSTYSKHVTIRTGGKYRVYAGVANGSFVPNTGTEVTIHTK
ncbi:MAG TPA: hypothetical protein VK501_05375 [Baekduia sp.]|uniref:hypothetical protein n=1 Tax=Baekduia sp. TaxID=2600305 RepID=UPI002D04518B|nr:hypothetical protein [Baekduia sp.]HMJ33329.1 hypothetical protein [Baekduia sp.]